MTGLRCLALVVLTIGMGQSILLGQQDSSPTDHVLEDSVWFDSEQSSILPVEVNLESADSMNRDSRWLPKPNPIKQSNKPAPVTGGPNISNWLGWLLLLLIAVLAIGLLTWVVSKAETPESAQARAHAAGQAKLPDRELAERIKHLPAELRRTDVNLRSEAERLMRRGDFDPAIILLFGHQLLLLDQSGMLRLNRGKTNRKYVRETASADPESATCLRATVDAFERSYFGRHSISQAEFVQLWDRNTELESIVRNRVEVAA